MTTYINLDGSTHSPPPYSMPLTEPIVVQPHRFNVLVPVGRRPTAAQPWDLDFLSDTEVIRFRQDPDMVEIFCRCSMPLSFELVDQNDHVLLGTKELDNCPMRNCVPQGLRTDTLISKTNGLNVLQFKRERRCVFNCCLPFCCFPLPFSRERLTVSGANGTALGTIRHDWSTWRSRLSVLNPMGTVMLKIEGPAFNVGCLDDLVYTVRNVPGQFVGSITKKYSGLVHEMCTDYDSFVLSIPRDMDVACKALLIAAVYHINFLFFEGALRTMPSRGVCLAACSNCNFMFPGLEFLSSFL